CEIFDSHRANSAIVGQGGKYLRNNIHGFEHGIKAQGGDLIQDNYIHDLGAADGHIASDGHIDGVLIQSGSGTVVRHNQIEAWDTSCVFVADNLGEIANVTVDNNRLINSSGKRTAYCVYSLARDGGVTGTRFTNNIMQRGAFGYASIDRNKVVW